MNITQKQRLYNTLEQLGLSTIETTVYLEILQMGSIQASVVARRLNLNRSTTRYTLENLVKKGFITQTRKNKTFYFTAENPEKIILILQKKQSELKSQEKQVSNILSDLKSLQNPQLSLPRVQIFEGAEGVKQAYANIVKESEAGCEIHSYVVPLKLSSQDQGETKAVQEFIAERINKKINNKVLILGNSIPKHLASNEKELRSTRLLKSQNGFDDFASEIIITQNSVYSFCVEGLTLFAYQVSHPSMTKMKTALFKASWDQAVSQTK